VSSTLDCAGDIRLFQEGSTSEKSRQLSPRTDAENKHMCHDSVACVNHTKCQRFVQRPLQCRRMTSVMVVLEKASARERAVNETFLQPGKSLACDGGYKATIR